jgi:hypothetical protein
VNAPSISTIARPVSRDDAGPIAALPRQAPPIDPASLFQSVLYEAVSLFVLASMLGFVATAAGLCAWLVTELE